MKRSIFAIISLAALAGFAQLAGAQSAAGKIGVVNVNVLMQNAPQANAARQALETEFAPVEREILALRQTLRTRQETLTRDAATMTSTQRAAAERELNDGIIDLQAKETKIEDNFKVRAAEEEEKVQRAVLEEVQKYASANGFDLVLSAGVLFAAPALDITAPVLQALQKRPAGAAAPAAPAATP